MAYQEITKQQNIEAVADYAYEELEHTTKVSSEPVSRDWMFRFFDAVENISNEDMQKIWGHILSGEIKSPNTYSYRTLEKLKNMTQQEAECFQLIASFALLQNKNGFIIGKEELMHKYNIKFNDIMKLEECGLMLSNLLYYHINFEGEEAVSIYNNKIYGIVRLTNCATSRIELPAYAFTESGKQLLDAICFDTNESYILDCLAYIHKNSNNVRITAHRINYVGKDEILYDETDVFDKKGDL